MAKSNPAATAINSRLKIEYNDKLRTELKQQLKLENVNEVPKLQKVIVSIGLGRSKDDKRIMEAAATTLAKITGQKPVATISKKSIASFKLRDGQIIGMKVTLRRNKMYEFTDKLINVVLPRLRDFHGVNHKSFDGRGNYTIGFEDQTIWPELSFEDTSTPHGLEVTFVTSTESDEHAKSLLESFGMPFVKEGSK